MVTFVQPTWSQIQHSSPYVLDSLVNVQFFQEPSGCIEIVRHPPSVQVGYERDEPRLADLPCLVDDIVVHPPPFLYDHQAFGSTFNVPG